MCVCACSQLMPTSAPKAAGWALGRQHLCCRKAWKEQDTAAAGICLHPVDRKDKRVLEKNSKEVGRNMSSRVQCSHSCGACRAAEPCRAAFLREPFSMN